MIPTNQHQALKFCVTETFLQFFYLAYYHILEVQLLACAQLFTGSTSFTLIAFHLENMIFTWTPNLLVQLLTGRAI